MVATKKDILIRRNTDYRLEGQWLKIDDTPKDLTGCQFKMQIRNEEGGETLYGTWTNGDGFQLQPLNGIWTLEIPKADMTDWAFKSAVYDIICTWPNAKIDPVLHGDVTLTPGVTV
jgi:hypothetical protein